MELIEVLDKNGNSTGEILERDEVHKRNLLHNEIAVFLINDKGETLLQKRSGNKKHNPNKWAICAGHVEAYESLENTVIREAKEELGIDIPIKELKTFVEKETKIRKNNSCITNYFYYKTNMELHEFIIQKEELIEVKWVSIEDIIKMLEEENDSIVFDKKSKYIFEKLKEIE